MKIVISTTAPDLDSVVDPRFGRCAFLLVVDTETLQWDAVTNAAALASGKAGIQAAQFAVNRKAEAVVSGDFGPNAYNALKAAGVAMYLFGLARSAREVVSLFEAGSLEKVGAATQPGHHGQSG